MAPTMQDLRTERSDAIEKARLRMESLEAAKGADPVGWTDAEREELNTLSNAAKALDDRFNEMKKAELNRNRISQYSTSEDEEEEERPRGRITINRHDKPDNIIQWKALNKRAIRNYVREGGQLSSPEYDDAFASYLRGNGNKMRELRQAQNVAHFTSDNEERAGYFFTGETFASELIKNVDDETYVQAMSRVIMLPNGTRTLTARVRREKASTFDWAGENTDITPTREDQLSYGKRSLTPHYLQGSVVLSRDLMRNAPSVQGMVMGEIAINLGEVLEQAFLTADGNQKPLGLLVASNNGISTARDSTSVATNFDFDDFVNMKYSLKMKYRSKANWMLHRYVLNQCALLKDGNGQYLWQPSRQVGEPERILGLPVTETEWMPHAASSGLYYALLGDFSHYWIVYELSMEMQRLDEMRAYYNETEFLFRSKLDAAPMLEEAFTRGKRA